MNTVPFWSVVGPDHQRLCFNHMNMVGYSKDKGEDEGFHIYGMNGEEPGESYSTIPAAKRAALAFAKRLVPELEKAPLIWTPLDTGHHWHAHVHKFQIANYYKCDEDDGNWHKDFRVWFCGTYYTIDFKDADEAQKAVEATWAEWLIIARQHLLACTKTQPSDWNP